MRNNKRGMMSFGHATYVYSAVIALAGILIYSMSDNFPEFESWMKLVSESMISAAIVSIVFNYFNQQDLANRVSDLFEGEFAKLFVSIKSNAMRTAWHFYRWDCMIERIDPKIDRFPSCLVQHIRISHTMMLDQKQLSFIAAVSRTVGALDEYTKRPDFIFRWRMQSSAEELDIENDTVFRVNRFTVGGSTPDLLADVYVDVAGGKARMLTYGMPKELIGTEVEVALDATVRKVFDGDIRIPVVTELRNEVGEAEFTLTVDPSVHAQDMEFDTDGIHPVNSLHRGMQTSSMSRGLNGMIQARITARHAISRGSSPKFTVVRAPQ